MERDTTYYGWNGDIIDIYHLNGLARKLRTYTRIYTGDKEAREMADWCDRAVNSHAALVAENAELRRLLIPFGKEGGCWADSVKDSYHPGMTEPGNKHMASGARAKFTVGHLRKVRDFLARTALSTNGSNSND